MHTMIKKKKALNLIKSKVLSSNKNKMFFINSPFYHIRNCLKITVFLVSGMAAAKIIGNFSVLFLFIFVKNTFGKFYIS